MQTEIETRDIHHHLKNYVIFGSSPTTSSEPSDASNIRDIIEKITIHNYNSL